MMIDTACLVLICTAVFVGLAVLVLNPFLPKFKLLCRLGLHNRPKPPVVLGDIKIGRCPRCQKVVKFYKDGWSEFNDEAE